MKDCMEVINTRSSIRKYTAEPLPSEVVRELVEAGLKAPTAANRQELHFTVVGRDDPVQAEIQHDLNPDATGNFYYNAPVTIYISGDEALGWSAVDAGIAVENIHLAASAMGLGSVILGCMKKVLNGEKKAEYAEKLGFPEGYGYQVAIAVGYPDTTKDQHAFDYEKNVTIL